MGVGWGSGVLGAGGGGAAWRRLFSGGFGGGVGVAAVLQVRVCAESLGWGARSGGFCGSVGAVGAESLGWGARSGGFVVSGSLGWLPRQALRLVPSP